MIIRVSELPDDGLSIDETAFAVSPYTDASWHLDRVTLRIDKDGDEVDVRGQVRATVAQLCGRCAEGFTGGVTADIDLRFAPKPARVEGTELGRDDLDTDFYEDDQIDLGRVIENETTLALLPYHLTGYLATAASTATSTPALATRGRRIRAWPASRHSWRASRSKRPPTI